MCVCACARTDVQEATVVRVRVCVSIVWRRRMVPPAPQGGLRSETGLVGDGRKRGTPCYWQTVSASKKLENYRYRNKDATY